MDIAALKVRHSIGVDIDTTHARCAREGTGAARDSEKENLRQAPPPEAAPRRYPELRGGKKYYLSVLVENSCSK